jgi:hypothetical protein
MSSRHGGQSMSHPIIILYSVWCISHSNSWSTSLAFKQKFCLKFETKFPNSTLKFLKQNLSFLARGFQQSSWQKSLSCRSFGLPFKKNKKILSIAMFALSIALFVLSIALFALSTFLA